jgi:hypothetical protein
MEGTADVEEKLNDNEAKKCWRCGFQIPSGSICPICGAVNKVGVNPSSIRAAEPEKASQNGGTLPDGDDAKINDSASTQPGLKCQCSHSDNEFLAACQTNLKVTDITADVGQDGPSSRPNLHRSLEKVPQAMELNMQDMSVDESYQRAKKNRFEGIAALSDSYDGSTSSDETPHQQSAEDRRDYS